jgi:general secretion pathway protein A
MGSNYKVFFGFKSDPFRSDVPTKDLLKLPGMIGVKERLDYCMDLGGVMVVTGEVGSGKSTSLRWARSHYHPSENCVISIIANSGSITEIYKLICMGLDLPLMTGSKAKLVTEAKIAIKEIVTGKKQRVVLIIDEANLLRPEVLTEIHTLSQFEHDSANMMSIVLCGQTNLLDRLTLRGSAPLASRVIARTHLDTLSSSQLADYLEHHLRIAGVKKKIYDDSAIMAVFQGSGGVLRKANSLARGGLIAAAIEKKDFVEAEHIRIAASELM